MNHGGFGPEFETALARAREARTAIERVVEGVRAGELSLAEAYAEADRDPLVGRTFAVKVHEAAPGAGKVATRRAMAALGLADDITLAEVPASAREALST